MKTTTVAVVAGLAFGIGASLATAHPTSPINKNPKKMSAVKVTIPDEMPAQDDYFDDFDSYIAGSDIVGQGGWELWYQGGQTAEVSDEQARSGKNSMRIRVNSDIVQRFTAEDGKWTFSVQTYVPSEPISAGDGFVILMDQYEVPPNHWSVQVQFSPANAWVQSQFDGGTLPLITDAWVELRCEIDLDNDTNQIFYDGALLSEHAYTEGVNGGGITSIACVDLYSDGFNTAGIEPMYFDDVTLKAVVGDECPPDLDGDGALTLFDFLEFVNLFNDKDPIADWDGDGEFTLFDFLGFVNDFNEGEGC